MVESFQDFNFPQSGDWHALLLIVHENTLERHVMAFRTMDSLVNLTAW